MPKGNIDSLMTTATHERFKIRPRRIRSLPVIAEAPTFSTACSHVRFQGVGRDYSCPLGRKVPALGCVRPATGSEDAGSTSSHARVGYRMTVVSSRSCLGLEASVGLGRLITGLEGSPPRSCLRRHAPLDLLASTPFLLCQRMASSGGQRRLRDLGNRPDEADHLASYGGRDHDLWLAVG